MSGAILRLLLVAGLLVLPFAAGAPHSSAQQAGEKKPAASKPNDAKSNDGKPAKETSKETGPKRPLGKEMPVITSEREAAALTFVREHHPELADLITVLKEKQPKEYQKALRDLFRASEKLAQIHDLDKARYELELKAWKLQSRIQLLTARLSMEPNDKLRGELKTALEQQYDNQLALVVAERERAKQRLETLDKQIENLQQRRAEAIERQVDTLSREAKRMNPKNRPVPAATGVK